MAYPDSEIKTKDSYDLEEILADGFEIIRMYNEEVERPFRDMFTRTVTERQFMSDRPGDMVWPEIGEGEHPVTDSLGERSDITMFVKEYALALDWNRQYVERNGRDRLVREIRELVEGYDKREHKLIFDALKNSAADGSGLWFDPPDRGSYDFSDTHDHTFTSTSDLFGNPWADQSYDTTAAQTATKHVRVAANHLRHHGKRPRICLMSSQFAERFKDELAWEANYHFPMATGLRENGLSDDARVDDVNLVQTPWLNDAGGGSYTFYIVSDDDPIAFNEEVSPTLARNEQGVPLNRANDLFNAHGYARVGLRTVDPLSVVKVTADSVA